MTNDRRTEVYRLNIAASRLVLGRLKAEKAPTCIGYNDMAIMIAFGQSDELGIPTVNTDMISRFLSQHPAVPRDARMSTQTVGNYLEVLARNNFIEEEQEEKNYRMRDDTSLALVADMEYLKSPHIDEFLFHGFRLHCAWQLRAQREERKKLLEGFEL